MPWWLPCSPFSSARPSFDDQAHNDNKRAKSEQVPPLVVFVYEGRNLLFPRPASYDDAVLLVQAHIVDCDLTKYVVRFVVHLPWLLPNEDVEVTPAAWAETIVAVSKLQVIIQRRSRTKATPPHSPDSVSGTPTAYQTSFPTAPNPPPKEVKNDKPESKGRSKSMQIKVQTPTGKVITLSGVKRTHTVQQLKEKIQGVEGTPVESQQLILEGVDLQDGSALSEYNVINNCTILLGAALDPEIDVPMVVRKPVIYLWPPSEMDVQIKLSLIPQWRFSAVYPLAPISSTPTPGLGQMVEWNVHALKDGTLTDKWTASDVAYLFWEARADNTLPISPPTSRPLTPSNFFGDDSPEESFIPGITSCDPSNSVLLGAEDVPSYLDRTLLALGLHTEARTSFITYWLPDILKLTFVALRFIPQVQFEKAAPLDIVPPPDVVTRVFMVFQGVEPQNLGLWDEAAERANESVTRWKEIIGTDEVKQSDESAFRVLEWGGMEVK